MMMNRRCPTVSLETLRSSLQVGGVILSPPPPPPRETGGAPPPPPPPPPHPPRPRPPIVILQAHHVRQLLCRYLKEAGVFERLHTVNRAGRQRHRRSCLRDELLVFARPVHSAKRVFDASGIHVLCFMLALVVLKAEPVPLLEYQELAGIAVRVRQPTLLSPGLRDNPDVIGQRNPRLSRLGRCVARAGI